LRTIESNPTSLSIIWDWSEYEEKRQAPEDGIPSPRDTLRSFSSSQCFGTTRTNALFDMANLALQCFRYEAAREILATAMAISSDPMQVKLQMLRVEIEQAMDKHRRLGSLVASWITRKVNRYGPSDGVRIVERTSRGTISALFDWASAMAQHSTKPVLDWKLFVADVLCHPIDANTLYEAAREDKPEDILFLISLGRPVGLAWDHLVDMAARNHSFSSFDLFDLIRKAPEKIGHLSQLINTILERRACEFDAWTDPSYSKVLPEKVCVDDLSIDTALKHRLPIKVLAALFDATDNALEISLKALETAASNCNEPRRGVLDAIPNAQPGAVEQVALLLSYFGPDYTVTEEVLIAIAGNRSQGMYAPIINNGMLVLTFLLENKHRMPRISECVLVRIMEGNIVSHRCGIVPRLQYFREIEMTRLVRETAQGLLSKGLLRAKLGEAVLKLGKPGHITQMDLISVMTSGRWAYLDTLLLCRQRPGDFTITPEVFSAAIYSLKWANFIASSNRFNDLNAEKFRTSERSSTILLNDLRDHDRSEYNERAEELLALLVEHADDVNLQIVVQQTQIVLFAMLNGYVSLLQKLSARLVLGQNGEYETLIPILQC
jgi:hypothetical protein